MKEKQREYSSATTEAWADHQNTDPITHVSLPSEEAVEAAKDWIELNEL